MGLQKYLLFPELPQKTAAFVTEIKKTHIGYAERIGALKKFFQQKGFIYTLKPDTYENGLDDFLFQRRRGFCEHFAAAFATLARALGVPARVVIGYQGGTYNPIGNFWKISQKDAHAWVEVGLDGKWRRVDPTALVAPLRTALGGDGYFSLSEDEQILYSKNKMWVRPKNLQGYLMQAQLLFENLNYYWTIFLLNYDLQAQIDFLKLIKAEYLVVAGVVILFLLFLSAIRKKRRDHKKKSHEIYTLYFQIESWAEKQGLEFAVNETPLGILKRLAENYPQTEKILHEISQQYERVAYEEKETSLDMKSLQKKWKLISNSIQ